MEFLGGLTKSSQGKAALGIAATVAAGYAAYTYLLSSTSNTDLLPALEEEEAYALMKKIFDKLRQSSEKLMGHLPSIQQQLQAQGMDVPPATIIKSYIFPHFEIAFKEIQAEVLAEADVEEFELEDAVSTYCKMGHPQLLEVSGKLRMLHAAMGGEASPSSGGEEGADAGEGGSGGDDSSSEDLSMDALMHVLARLSKHMEVEMDTYCKAFISANDGPPSTAEGFQEFQAGMVAISDK
jgi:hypothetical protein